jgi:PAS domain-containing protein
MVRKDGNLMSVLLNASVIRDADGQYVSSRSTVFDITERNRAKQDLAKQTTILQSVLNSMGEGVVVADMDGRFVLWNPAADRLLRLGPAHLLPKEWSTYCELYLPDQITVYPIEQLPLVRAIRGESVDSDEQFVPHSGRPSRISLSVRGRPSRMLPDTEGSSCSAT